MTESTKVGDRTPAVLAHASDAFGERLVPVLVKAKKTAAQLPDGRTGDPTREDATRLGRLFDTPENAGQVRQDWILPASAWQKEKGQLYFRMSQPAIAHCWIDARGEG